MKHRQLHVNEQIILRLLRHEDAPTLFAVIDANRDYLKQWMPWVDANATVQDSEAFIATTHKQFSDGLGLNGAIFYDNTFVGMCGYHAFQKVDHSISLGYWLHPDYQGRGIVTSCVKTLIAYAFENLAVNSVRCAHALGNDKSRAVIERCGFVYDGSIRQGEYLYDHYVDLSHYSILRSEWQNITLPVE